MISLEEAISELAKAYDMYNVHNVHKLFSAHNYRLFQKMPH
jgi:hypothetical protein